MSEFEASRVIGVPREQVYAVAADVDRLPEWVPAEVHVAPVSDGVVRADGPAVPDAPEDGVVGSSAEQMRVEWGDRGEGIYAGWLQLHEQGQGECEAVLHLSFLGDQPQAHGGAAARDVERMLAESLDRLAQLAAS